jgi:hypothetical protein
MRNKILVLLTTFSLALLACSGEVSDSDSNEPADHVDEQKVDEPKVDEQKVEFRNRNDTIKPMNEMPMAVIGN